MIYKTILLLLSLSYTYISMGEIYQLTNRPTTEAIINLTNTPSTNESVWLTHLARMEAAPHEPVAERLIRFTSQTLIRTCEVDGKAYSILYHYNEVIAIIPAVMGAKPHYPALIEVYLRDKKDLKFIASFQGQVIPDGGCFEDTPIDMVKQAYEILKKENSIKELIKEESKKD